MACRKSISAIPVPYAVTLGAVNIAGVLYLENPIENSYSDGAFIGVVVGTYHIDKNHAEASADNGILKVSVKLDFAGSKLYGRLCTRKPFGGWDCSDWEEIASW